MEMEGLFKIPLLIVGAIGGGLGILFGQDKPKTPREWIKASIFVGAGAVITNFLTPLVLHWFPSFINLEYSIALIVGLFGIGIVKALFNVVKMLNTDFFGTIDKIKGIFKRS